MTSLILLLAFICPANAAVVLLGDQPIVQKPYVTVAPDGSAETIIPIVTSTDGAVYTISPIPEFVTKTSVHASTGEDGRISISTDTAPIASATSTVGAGAFILCHDPQGVDGPFCSPRDGSTVEPGGTYYITWDPRWFPTKDEPIRVQGSYFESGLPDTIGGTIAFISGNITAGRGFYPWNVDEEKVFVHSNITLSLSYMLSDSSTTDAIKGPTVKVVKADGSTLATFTITDDGETNRPLAIALPIALIGTSVVVTGLWFYLRNKQCSSAVHPTSSNRWPGCHQHYNINKTGSRRLVDRIRNRDISGDMTFKLWDTSTHASVGGQNVFKEDIRR